MGRLNIAGEGAKAFYAGTDEGGKNECHRANTAYPVLATTDPEEGKHFDELTFLACAGALTDNVVAPSGTVGHPQGDEPGTQVEQYAQVLKDHPGFTPALGIVMLGGNDAGFSNIGQICLAPATARNLRSRAPSPATCRT